MTDKYDIAKKISLTHCRTGQQILLRGTPHRTTDQN